MPKVAFGEKTAELVADVIRANVGRTSTDIACLANDEIAVTYGPDRATLSSTAINSYLSYHPEGQAIAAEGLVARERGKMPPRWANEDTPVAESLTKKVGQLVTYSQPTGVVGVDFVNQQAVESIHRIAKALPNRRQRDVLTVSNALQNTASMVRVYREAVDLLRGDRKSHPMLPTAEELSETATH